jgi:membrane protein implicated in regulation of membrane protease activity
MVTRFVAHANFGRGFEIYEAARMQMKTICVATLALFFAALSFPVLMHGKSQSASQSDKSSDLMDIKGTVRSDNAKITFVADEGGKSWDVVNPETLKNYVDKHVEVNAHVFSDKGQIHIESVVAI